MGITTTEKIITEHPISRLIMMSEEQRNKSKNKEWVALDELEKIMISLAYQKVDGKIKRININHLDVIKRLKEQ